MAKFFESEESKKLRKKGRSLSEIAQKLNVSKSSVSLWCRDIKLDPGQKIQLEERKRDGSCKGGKSLSEKYTLRRFEEKNEFTQKGLKDVGNINYRDLFICGLAIYWSEGYTYNRASRVGVTNMDPRMIKLMMRWFREVCNVSEDRLRLRLQINDRHKEKEKELKCYWSKITGIPLEKFTKTTFIKTEKENKSKSKYLGVLRITALDGRRLRYKIEGWIDALNKNAIGG